MHKTESMGVGGSVPFNENAHVVIVGGGYAGCILGTDLQAVCKVTIIDPKDSFCHNVGCLRVCVCPEYATKTFIPFDQTFGESFVRGKVVKIDKASNSVTLEDGKSISYTHLVIATGFASPFPGKVTKDYPNVSKSEGIELYQNVNKQIEEVQNIVCVGGGAVGVELAGEIKTEFPGKSVTLIHSSEVLCSSRMKSKAQDNLHAGIKAKEITLMLKERVSNLDELKLNEVVKGQVIKTESGKEIEADLIFPCTGSIAGSNVFKDDLGDAVAERGDIKVDQHFLVQGTTNIYAIGDIASTGEDKMAFIAECHAHALCKILQALFSETQPKPYQASSEFAMLVPLGKNGGVSEFKGFVLGDFATRKIKSEQLFTPKYWKMMKQKMPV